MTKPEEYQAIENILDNSIYQNRYKNFENDVPRRTADLEKELTRLKSLEAKDIKNENYHHWNKKTLLMEAASRDSAFAIGPLLNHENNINERNNDKMSAIMIAVSNGRIETAKMLFDSGAKLSDIFEPVIPGKGKKISPFDRVYAKGNIAMGVFLHGVIQHEIENKMTQSGNDDVIQDLLDAKNKIRSLIEVSLSVQASVSSRPFTDAELKEEVETTFTTVSDYLKEVVLPKTAAYKAFTPNNLEEEYKNTLAGRKIPLKLEQPSKIAEADNKTNPAKQSNPRLRG